MPSYILSFHYIYVKQRESRSTTPRQPVLSPSCAATDLVEIVKNTEEQIDLLEQSMEEERAKRASARRAHFLAPADQPAMEFTDESQPELLVRQVIERGMGYAIYDRES